MILCIENLHVYYGESHILQGVDLHISPGEIVCLLGRNGMGKTTLLRSIIGLVPPRSGRVLFKENDICGLPTYAIARRGISYIPQGREIFPGLTVLENLKLGTRIAGKTWEIPEQVFQFFPVLRERLLQKGGTLSGGEQQMLAIARGLAGRPALMLLDEPTEGIQPSIVQQLRSVLQTMNRELGLSILLVEQNLDFAFRVSSRAYIMEKGRIVNHGPVDALRDDTLIKQHLAL